eukprot:1528773-Rhodomonas_salina.1
MTWPGLSARERIAEANLYKEPFGQPVSSFPIKLTASVPEVKHTRRHVLVVRKGGGRVNVCVGFGGRECRGSPGSKDRRDGVSHTLQEGERGWEGGLDGGGAGQKAWRE